MAATKKKKWCAGPGNNREIKEVRAAEDGKSREGRDRWLLQEEARALRQAYAGTGRTMPSEPIPMKLLLYLLAMHMRESER